MKPPQSPRFSIKTDVFSACEIKTGPCWKHPLLKKCLIRSIIAVSCICVFLTLLTIIILLLRIVGKLDQFQTASNQIQSTVCLTPGCVKAASHIIESMDSTVSPCQDFYQFTCGGWQKGKHIHEDQTGLTEFGALRDALNRELRLLVEETSKESDPEFFKMMRIIYKQCMNTTLMDEYGYKPLIDSITQVGGWPVLEGGNWTKSESFDWLDSSLEYRKLGFNHNLFFAIFVGPDVKNNTRHIAQIDQPSLGVPNRKYLLKGKKDPVVKAYFNMMIEAVSLIRGEAAGGAGAGDSTNQSIVEEEMSKVLDFETTLANLTLPMEERRNFTKLYHKMKLSELHRIADNGIFFGENITLDEEIVVKVPSYVVQVDRFLASADKRVIANYMVWRLVQSSMGQLGKAWQALSEKYDQVLTGRSRERPRWDVCMRRLFGSFNVPLSSVYVRKHFDSESRAKATEMVNYIHGEFLRVLESVEWMDSETKKRAILKAQAINSHIGFPKELLNNQKILELYDGLKIVDNTSFYANVQELRVYWTNYDLKKLRTPYDKKDWKRFSNSVSIIAFYNSLENSIKFPAGILQGIFFNRNRPNYLNYGAIGYIIGHEITHGFDDRGRQFDQNGNNVNWWKSATDEKFREKASCIIEQYGNYTLPETNETMNGVNTQGENIADNGGIKEAYRGYLRYVRDHGPEPSLPGLTMTPNQLFWVSAANVWCAKIRPESLKLRVQTGVHSPPRFRVIGPMCNSPDFAKDFNCPLGSAMNPFKKCTIW